MAETATATATATAAPAGAPPAKKKGGRLVILLVVAFLLLGGGGGGAYWYFMLRHPAAEAAAAPKKDEHKAGTGIVPFEPFVVNLADPGGTRFLRISVRLVVENQKEAKEITENEVMVVRLRSAVLELLTQQTSDKLVTTEGKDVLKKSIAEHASKLLAPVEVSDVLFSDFVVQF